MDFINYFLENSVSGNYFYIVGVVALIVSFILLKERRVKFLIPVTILSIIILNPIFFKKWSELGGYAYFRIVWMVPLIPICAVLPAVISEKIKNKIAKPICGTVLAVALCFAGTFIYNPASNPFTMKAENKSKIPEAAVEIANYLLEEDENPRVVATTDIAIYLRQYSGNIKTLYGRDVLGHICDPSAVASAVNKELTATSGNMEYVAQTMLDEGYDYLVIREKSYDERDELAGYGFQFIQNIKAYDIFKVYGTPSVIKEKNLFGQVTKETLVDDKGLPINGRDGYSIVDYEYDSAGNVIKSSRTNVDGEFVVDKQGSAGFERRYDRYFQVISDKNIGKKGEISENALGYVEVKSDYVKRQFMGESYYDQTGALVNRRDKRYAQKRIERKNDNRTIEESYYDADGFPTYNNDFYFMVKKEYDEKGSVIDEIYYDIYGDRTITKQGVAERKLEYDDKYHVIKETYLDEKGELINHIDGYALIIRTYSEEGKLLVEVFYDENKQQVIEKNYDTNEKLICQRKGEQKTLWGYDDSGRLVSEEYHNLDDSFMTSADGFVRLERQYDDAGNLILESYYNEKGEKVLRNQGYAEVRKEYDENNRIIKESYYDENEVAILLPAGYSGKTWEYDDRGNVLSEGYLDKSGKKVLINTGYAEIRYTYDEMCRKTSESYYDVNGDRVALSDGLSKIDKSFDLYGNVIKELYYDANDNLIVRYQGYAGIEKEYDGFNRIITMTYLDDNGKKVCIPHDYATKKIEYDEWDRVISESYYDENGNPMIGNMGYARIVKEYDKGSNVIVEKYFDSDGQDINSIYGYAKVMREYDNKQLITEKYYDSDGEPYYYKEGFCGIKNTYDEDGNLISRKFINEDGEMILRTDGFSELKWEKNERTGVINQKAYNIDGNEVSLIGINLYQNKYSEWSEWITPNRNINNIYLELSTINLGDKKCGDLYECNIDIEFDGAENNRDDFGLCAQGPVDGGWSVGNIWNTSLINSDNVYSSGLHSYTSTQVIDEGMEKASFFSIGLRCDNWNGGSFRVRNISICRLKEND